MAGLHLPWESSTGFSHGFNFVAAVAMVDISGAHSAAAIRCRVITLRRLIGIPRAIIVRKTRASVRSECVLLSAGPRRKVQQ